MSRTATLNRRRTIDTVQDPTQADRARTDEVLLARLYAGDEYALALVYDQHGEMVYRLARRVTVDEQLAQDITQEVFALLWEKPDRVDLTRGSLKSYLGVVTHRRAVDVVRRVTRRGQAEAMLSNMPIPVDRLDDDVAASHALVWWRERLEAALEQLPEEQRAAVVLAYLQGQSYKEVARLLGIPEGTAKSRIRLGLARVRAIVGDDWQSER
jgi:RNA polymerase sigma factor (sigma-70 family)